MERFEAGDKNEEELSEAGRRKTEKDKAAAEDIRFKAMERMNETKKRKVRIAARGKGRGVRMVQTPWPT